MVVLKEREEGGAASTAAASSGSAGSGGVSPPGRVGFGEKGTTADSNWWRTSKRRKNHRPLSPKKSPKKGEGN